MQPSDNQTTPHINMTQPTNRWDFPHFAAHHTPPAFHQKEQKQPTALLRTIGCPGRTHSPSATPDLTRPLQIIDYPGRTHLPTASLDLHTSPDNRLPEADSLASSLARSLRYSGHSAAQDGLTRQQLHRITLRIFAERLPRHLHASSRSPLTYSS
jgi:hypothetical protein